MSRFAIIEDGKVANIVEAEVDFAAQQKWIAASNGSIGDTYENGEFIKPVPIIDPLAYQAQRVAAYPPITDYIDGVVKGDTAQVQAYIDACLAIKTKYPKPV